MAVRGPQRPTANPLKPVGPGQTDKKLSNVEQALLQSGIAKTPQEAKKLAAQLLGALKGKGVPANTLPVAIKQFQKDAGLKQTGNLDKETMTALQQQGLLPTPGKGDKAPGKAGQPGVPAGAPGKQVPTDGMVRAPVVNQKVTGQPTGAQVPVGTQGQKTGEAGHRVGLEQTKALVEHMQLPDHFGPQDLLENLASLGFFGAGKGADQLREAIRSFQRAAGLPASGKVDPETAGKLQEQGALPEGQGSRGAEGQDGQGRADGAQGKGADDAGKGASAAQGRAAESAGNEKARSESRMADENPNARGVKEGEGDPRAKEGRGAEGEGRAKRKGKGGHGDATEGEGGAGGVDDGDEDGTETDDANSPAGDDDLEDQDRGHAQLKKDADDEAGHYAIPSLAEQLAEALEQIERDDDGRGPVTYTWDVTFYRPGVYGAFQPAEPLWHIGIEKVTAFDSVWANACKALAERMAQTEPERDVPTQLDFERALRRARARSTP